MVIVCKVWVRVPLKLVYGDMFNCLTIENGNQKHLFDGKSMASCLFVKRCCFLMLNWKRMWLSQIGPGVIDGITTAALYQCITVSPTKNACSSLSYIELKRSVRQLATSIFVASWLGRTTAAMTCQESEWPIEICTAGFATIGATKTSRLLMEDQKKGGGRWAIFINKWSLGKGSCLWNGQIIQVGNFVFFTKNGRCVAITVLEMTRWRSDDGTGRLKLLEVANAFGTGCTLWPCLTCFAWRYWVRLMRIAICFFTGSWIHKLINSKKHERG